MTIHFHEAIRNERADDIERVTGEGPLFQIWDGTVPANTAASSTGNCLVEMQLPDDWLDDAAAGQKEKLGLWSGVGIFAGVATYFRIVSQTSDYLNEVMMQGTCTELSDGGDAIIDDVNIDIDKPVTVVLFRTTEFD